MRRMKATESDVGAGPVAPRAGPDRAESVERHTDGKCDCGIKSRSERVIWQYVHADCHFLEIGRKVITI